MFNTILTSILVTAATALTGFLVDFFLKKRAALLAEAAAHKTKSSLDKAVLLSKIAEDLVAANPDLVAKGKAGLALLVVQLKERAKLTATNADDIALTVLEAVLAGKK